MRMCSQNYFLGKPNLDGLAFDVLDSQEMEQLERLFDELDVKKVLKCVACDKTPGPDGFCMAFFKHVGK